MTSTLHELTVPVFIRALGNLSAFLKKGSDHADAHGIAHSEYLEARLAPDMAPLVSQIQRASDAAKGLLVRLGGVPNEAFADEEVSFADLQARIARTIAFLEATPADALAGKEDASVVLETPGRSFTFTGLGYVQNFALPNFFFHVTTAYALLRHKGVPVGKMDFLGGM